LLQGCDQQPLGMKDGRIGDHQISASSSWMDEHPNWSHGSWYPHDARFDGPTGWHWDPNNDDASGGWIEVDLLKDHIVTGIITQGRGDGGDNYVKTYKVMYKKDGDSHFTTVNSETRWWGDTIFFGDASRRNNFVQPFEGRIVRIDIRSFKGQSVMRFELIGCPTGKGYRVENFETNERDIFGHCKDSCETGKIGGESGAHYPGDRGLSCTAGVHSCRYARRGYKDWFQWCDTCVCECRTSCPLTKNC